MIDERTFNKSVDKWNIMVEWGRVQVNKGEYTHLDWAPAMINLWQLKGFLLNIPIFHSFNKVDMSVIVSSIKVLHGNL